VGKRVDGLGGAHGAARRLAAAVDRSQADATRQIWPTRAVAAASQPPHG
jgi:hypothetical protein